jgi:phospholipase/carboxylesterase
VSPRNVATTLDFDASIPSGAGPGTTVAVLLHGRGSQKGDLQGLRPHLPEAWGLVTPQAPFPGSAWGYGPGWAWYRYLDEDRIERATLEEGLSKLEAFLGDLPEILGFDPGRVFLGGFSQGGTTSLTYALTRPQAVAAALVFSGFLPASVELDETGGAPPATPVFWAHGRGDPAIPITLAARGRHRLQRAGARLVTRDYPIGHWIVPDEIRDAVDWLNGPAYSVPSSC